MDTMKEPAVAPYPRSRFSIFGRTLFATTVMLVLTVGVVGWAATARLSGAVIASGSFVVERNVKKVQHSYGGIVAEINVKNGDEVRVNDVLLRLDGTQVRAELAIITSQLDEHRIRAARLAAERDNLPVIAVPESLVVTASAETILKGETRLFEEARQTRESQKQQLRLRIEQLEEEITGLEGQRDAKQAELGLIERELNQVRGLHEKGLTPVSRVYAMEREIARLQGERGGFVAQIARSRGQISEIRVQILAVDEQARVQAQRELRATEARVSELSERAIAARDKLERLDLRAPQTGIVHELTVHTIGGVVTAAEQLMIIVPKEDALTVQARVSPADVDQVIVGGPAILRLSAFNQQTTPELHGQITHLSADVTLDPKSGQSHYVARIEMTDRMRRKMGDLLLVPGMPVEVFIATGERTALSYLAKPLTDQFSRAFRE